jgi:hypothetical protein
MSPHELQMLSEMAISRQLLNQQQTLTIRLHFGLWNFASPECRNDGFQFIAIFLPR